MHAEAETRKKFLSYKNKYGKNRTSEKDLRRNYLLPNLILTMSVKERFRNAEDI